MHSANNTATICVHACIRSPSFFTFFSRIVPLVPFFGFDSWIDGDGSSEQDFGDTDFAGEERGDD